MLKPKLFDEFPYLLLAYIYGLSSLASKMLQALGWSNESNQSWKMNKYNINIIFCFTYIGALSAGAKFLKNFHPGVHVDGAFTCCRGQSILTKGCELMHLSEDGNCCIVVCWTTHFCSGVI